MPTRPGFDVIPLKKGTKEALSRLRGEGTYDAAIRALLDRALEPAAPVMERPRAPEEQLALADLAKRRWDIARERGVIEEVGPRLIVYRTGRRERGRLRVSLP